jgi:hypothetical protein
VTSGLDETADWEIMRLLRCLSAQYAGVPAMLLFAEPAEALDFFAVNRLGDVLSRIDELAAEHWRAKFESKADASADSAAATESYTGRHRPGAQRRPEPSLVTVGRMLRRGAISLTDAAGGSRHLVR